MMIDERNLLTQKDETKNKVKINYINNYIAELEAEENRNKIFKNFSSFTENPDSVNMQQMWKLLKNLWPKTNPTLPTVKRNHRGKIVSGPTEIKKLLAKEYKDRLRTRPIRPDFLKIKKRKK